MATIISKRATVDDLLRTEGKAELIGGRIVHLMPTGRIPNNVAGRIYRSLDDYAEASGQGEAYTDNISFTIPELPSGRELFSPDASCFRGPYPTTPMKFIERPPTLAVEVRSENDYGPAAGLAMAEKRGDCFAAGTLVVWDVVPVAELIHVDRATDPSQPATCARGQTAEAEPAVPGWQVGVDGLFGTG